MSAIVSARHHLEYLSERARRNVAAEYPTLGSGIEGSGMKVGGKKGVGVSVGQERVVYFAVPYRGEGEEVVLVVCAELSRPFGWPCSLRGAGRGGS